MNYVYGRIKPGKGAASLTTLRGVDDDYELLRGVSRKDGFPEDAQFEMDRDYPNNIKLEDVVDNTSGLLVVSSRFGDLVTTQKARNVEFLPVTIVNHKGRKEKEPYFIFHQVNLQDCIDLSQSVFERNPIDTNIFITLETLVIDEKRVDPGVAVFRMTGYPFLPIFRRDLAEKIQEAELTGIRFRELDQWTGTI